MKKNVVLGEHIRFWVICLTIWSFYTRKEGEAKNSTYCVLHSMSKKIGKTRKRVYVVKKLIIWYNANALRNKESGTHITKLR